MFAYWLYGCCLCVQNPCAFSHLVFLFSGIYVFLVTLLALQGESAAAVLCPVGDSDPAAAAAAAAAVSNLSAVALHLGPGSHVHPAAPASLLAGFKKPCRGSHIPVSRVRGGLSV